MRKFEISCFVILSYGILLLELNSNQDVLKIVLSD